MSGEILTNDSTIFNEFLLGRLTDQQSVVCRLMMENESISLLRWKPYNEKISTAKLGDVS